MDYDYTKECIIRLYRLGKTALLTAVTARAADERIPVLRANAKRGFLNDIHFAVDTLLAELEKRPSMSVQDISISLSAFGVGGSLALGRSRKTRYNPESRTTFATLLSTLVGKLQSLGKPGLLVIIDEMNFKHARDVTLDHIVTFSTAYQNLIEDKRKIGVVISGLPLPILRAQRNQHISFLGRGEFVRLKGFDYQGSIEAVQGIAATTGAQITPAAAARIAAFGKGNPYMLQEAGYLAFEQASGDAVTEDAVDSVRDEFYARVTDAVVGIAYDELAASQKKIIKAIVTNPSVTPKELARTLHVKETSLPQMRKELVDTGLIVPDKRTRGRYVLDFPYMSDYVKALDEEPDDSVDFDRIAGFPDV